MIRTALIAVVACLVMAAPAAASELRLVKDHVEVHNPQQDMGQNCGFPVLWDIHISADRYRWYDEQDRIVRYLAYIHEDNTVKNLATGKTVRDGPVDFVRTQKYENGVSQYTVDTGLMVNIRAGRESVLDYGSVKYRVESDGTWNILGGFGSHPVYNALDGNQFISALGAFCKVVD